MNIHIPDIEELRTLHLEQQRTIENYEARLNGRMAEASDVQDLLVRSQIEFLILNVRQMQINTGRELREREEWRRMREEADKAPGGPIGAEFLPPPPGTRTYARRRRNPWPLNRRLALDGHVRIWSEENQVYFLKDAGVTPDRREAGIFTTREAFARIADPTKVIDDGRGAGIFFERAPGPEDKE